MGMGRATGSRIAAISSDSAALISAAPILRPKRPSAIFEVTLRAVSTPMSDPMSRSSRLSSIASSSIRARSVRGGGAGLAGGAGERGRCRRRGRGASAGAGSSVPSSRMASRPSSSFDDDLNSLSLSFWKNAMPSPRPPMPTPKPASVGMQTPQGRRRDQPAAGSLSTRRMVPSLTWAWIAFVSSIWAASPSFRGTSSIAASSST